jgi:hypothetical protein
VGIKYKSKELGEVCFKHSAEIFVGILGMFSDFKALEEMLANFT